MIEHANKENSKAVRVLTRFMKSIGEEYSNESQAGGINRTINYALKAKELGKRALKGKFTKEEWIGMIDAYNGTLPSEMFYGRKKAFIFGMEDADELDNQSQRFGYDSEELKAKLNALTDLHILHIEESIYTFWNHYNNGQNLNKFINQYL